jgi:phage FluMu gp28-like protein
VEVINYKTRFNVMACGRRFGKTTLGIDRIIRPMLDGKPVGWFSPTYKMLADVWRDMKNVLQPVTKQKSEQEKRIELITGGVLDMWSLDHPDAARGRKYARAVIDEAAMIAKLQEAWQEAIRPTLTDYSGDAFFLSTPKGLNYFKTLFDYGNDPTREDWTCWQLPTAANPFISPHEIDAARYELPERVFRQEYLAQFVEDANLFRNINACATARRLDHAEAGHTYMFGVDWGKLNDFTVITVWDQGERELVKLDRFNQIDYTVQSGRLKTLYEKFKPRLILAESNSMGEPIIDQLKQDGLPVKGFTTTNISKGQIINALSLAFEQEAIKIPNDPVLIAELQAFEATRLPGGSLRYAAPEGQHDDTVIATAIGLEAMTTRYDLQYQDANPFYS